MNTLCVKLLVKLVDSNQYNLHKDILPNEHLLDNYKMGVVSMTL